MKVKIKNLEPNPFRRIDKYPILRIKVDALKASITKTEFWDNILARPKDNNWKSGKYEIAYGHHRLIALKELGINEVDIPIKEISDVNMLLIMAHENKSDWGTTPAVNQETIIEVKRYIDAELAKYETWKEAKRVNSFISTLYKQPEDYTRTRNSIMENKPLYGSIGVGQTIILEFLGEPYKQWEIQEALTTLKLINDGILSEEVVRKAPSLKVLQNFKSNIKDNPISKEEQVVYMDEMLNDKTSKREVDNFFFDKQYKGKPKEKKKAAKLIEFEDFVRGITFKADAFLIGMEELIKFKDEFNSETYRKMLGKYVLIMKLNRISDIITNFLNLNSNDETKKVSRKELPSGSIL